MDKFSLSKIIKGVFDKWEKFLHSLQMPSCPIFYQHVTANVMGHVVKLKLPATNTVSTSSQSTSLTYEEENAIRCVGGYFIKSVKAMLNTPQDDELIPFVWMSCVSRMMT